MVSGLFGEGSTTTESAGLKVIEYRYYELASIRLSAHWISQRKIATRANGKGAICRNSPSIVSHVCEYIYSCGNESRQEGMTSRDGAGRYRELVRGSGEPVIETGEEALNTPVG